MRTKSFILLGKIEHFIDFTNVCWFDSGLLFLLPLLIITLIGRIDFWNDFFVIKLVSLYLSSWTMLITKVFFIPMKQSLLGYFVCLLFNKIEPKIEDFYIVTSSLVTFFNGICVAISIILFL